MGWKRNGEGSLFVKPTVYQVAIEARARWYTYGSALTITQLHLTQNDDVVETDNMQAVKTTDYFILAVRSCLPEHTRTLRFYCSSQMAQMLQPKSHTQLSPDLLWS